MGAHGQNQKYQEISVVKHHLFCFWWFSLKVLIREKKKKIRETKSHPLEQDS